MSRLTCPRCSQTFECGADQPDQTCWCMQLPVLKQSDEQQSLDCWCPHCLREELAKNKD